MTLGIGDPTLGTEDPAAVLCDIVNNGVQGNPLCSLIVSAKKSCLCGKAVPRVLPFVPNRGGESIGLATPAGKKRAERCWRLAIQGSMEWWKGG